MIATVDLANVVGFVIQDVGEYRQIELFRRHARIVGYVPAKSVTFTQPDFTSHGSGSGHGFGKSHADKLDIPAGTCLFDKTEGGEVVGVQSELSTRLGTRKLDVAGWWQVHVGTNWMIASLYVRDTSTDPTQPKWESCTQPAHR